MLWKMDQTRHLFEKIKDDNRADSHVHIFTAMDADSVCSCKILELLLRKEYLSYSVWAVDGYEAIHEKYTSSIKGQSGVRSIFFINCGATMDMLNFFEDLDPLTILYVADSHRPIALENTMNGAQIRVIDDDTQRDEVPDVPEGYDDDENLSDESSSDSEEEEAEYDPNTDAGNVTGQKRSGPKPESLRKKKRRARQEIRQYYSGTYHGLPSAQLMYDMASQVNKHDNDMLWYALVGLTDQLVHERIMWERYVQYYHNFKDEVQERFVASGKDAEGGGGVDGSQDSGSSSFSRGSEDRIDCCEDFRFMAYRHWALHDSMFHSNCLATRLKIWTEPGRALLAEFLAKMGISMEQSQQRFSAMDRRIRDNMMSKMEQYADEFELTGAKLTMPTFTRSVGFVTRVSSSDVVYSLVGLLENVSGTPTERFHNALDSLALSNSSCRAKFDKGVASAITMQQALVEQGVALIEKKMIRSLGPMRMGILVEGHSHRFFQHPITLSKLALFIVNVFRESDLKNKYKPLLLAAPSADEQNFVVVGVSGTAAAETQKNNFGTFFREAAQECNVEIVNMGFEGSCCTIDRIHWDAFTNALHDKMALAKAEEDDAKDKAAGDDDNAGDQGEGGDDQLDEDGNENAAALAAGGDLDMAAQEDRDADLADLGDGDQLGNENPDDSLHGSDELNSSLPLGVDVDAADVEDAVDGAEQDGEEEDLADAEQQDNEDMQDNDDEEDVDPEFLGEEDSEDENDEQEQQSAE